MTFEATFKVGTLVSVRWNGSAQTYESLVNDLVENLVAVWMTINEIWKICTYT